MSIGTAEEVAMVLPLPVKKGSDDDALKFINLKNYPLLFNDMENGFPAPAAIAGPFASAGASVGRLVAPVIEVKSVGAFDASYVPTIADFSRLDARFQIPAGTWAKLGGYRRFGLSSAALAQSNESSWSDGVDKAEVMAWIKPK